MALGRYTKKPIPEGTEEQMVYFPQPVGFNFWSAGDLNATVALGSIDDKFDHRAVFASSIFVLPKGTKTAGKTYGELCKIGKAII